MSNEAMYGGGVRIQGNGRFIMSNSNDPSLLPPMLTQNKAVLGGGLWIFTYGEANLSEGIVRDNTAINNSIMGTDNWHASNGQAIIILPESNELPEGYE
jgi:hypothetical protein